MEPFPIFIGYDDREDLAYKICEYTLRKYSSIPLETFPLNHRELRLSSDFDREWIVDGPTGRYKDVRDGRFFSTQFSHTRFLVPHLYRKYKLKHGYAMFVDCDFVFQQDVKDLLFSIEGSRPLSVVKHNYLPNSSVKMDYQKQWQYSYKLWSSLMVFNMHSPENLKLTKEEVNYRPGSWLHSFQWLTDPFPKTGHEPDSQIQGLDEKWNYIPDHSKTPEIGAVHYTEGLPFMKGYENGSQSNIWYKEVNQYNEDTLRT